MRGMRTGATGRHQRVNQQVENPDQFQITAPEEQAVNAIMTRRPQGEKSDDQDRRVQGESPTIPH